LGSTDNGGEMSKVPFRDLPFLVKVRGASLATLVSGVRVGLEVLHNYAG
jgi:hypothetical protein